MTIRCRFLLTAVFVCVLAAIPACYTITKHPRLASLDYARPDDQSCSNCHSTDEIWAFNHASKKPTHKSYSKAWIRYYDTAWWYDKKWKYRPPFEKESSQKEKTSDNEN